MNNLLLTFYGDDFTGSTDAMEGLALNGVPTALFFEPPTREHLQDRFANLRAVGIAGISRSLSPTGMEAELRPKFAALKALGAPLTHYKVCSTFDSSPNVGSIGKAIDIGWEVFNPPLVPLMVGAPSLKRFVAFGNLFATVGETTYRIDRHPTMSKHPITPMHESDLRLHLGQQTDKRIDLIDIRQLALDEDSLTTHFQHMLAQSPEIVLFDTLDESHLLKIGRFLWNVPGAFIAGSSGVEYALAAYWHAAGIVKKPPLPDPADRVDQMLVISGSASPVSAEQITQAQADGFAALRVDSTRLVNPNAADVERATIVEQALNTLEDGQSVILYSAMGPDDPAIKVTHDFATQHELKDVGARLGAQQGLILRALLNQVPAINRVCVAGGDTCSHAVQQLELFALEMLTPIAPGGPLCRASSHLPRYDGLEIVLKGGQVGQADFYSRVLQGGGQKVLSS